MERLKWNKVQTEPRITAKWKVPREKGDGSKTVQYINMYATGESRVNGSDMAIIERPEWGLSLNAPARGNEIPRDINRGRATF